MILNHLNLPVADPKAVAQFFRDCFEFEILTEDSFIIVMRGAGNFILNVMRDEEAGYPRLFHTGFTAIGREQLETVHAKVLASGYRAQDIEHIRRPTGYEALEFMITAPCGILVEVQLPVSI